MPYHISPAALLNHVQRSDQTLPSELKKSWIGKALKWSAAGVTFTLIGKDVFGNVVFKETCDATLDSDSVLIEHIILDTGMDVYFDSSVPTTIGAAVATAGGFVPLASKVATWVIDDILNGTISLQSAEVTTAIGTFPHTHGSIVDYDLASITDGDEIGLGAA